MKMCLCGSLKQTIWLAFYNYITYIHLSRSHSCSIDHLHPPPPIQNMTTIRYSARRLLAFNSITECAICNSHTQILHTTRRMCRQRVFTYIYICLCWMYNCIWYTHLTLACSHKHTRNIQPKHVQYIFLCIHIHATRHTHIHMMSIHTYLGHPKPPRQGNPHTLSFRQTGSTLLIPYVCSGFDYVCFLRTPVFVYAMCTLSPLHLSTHQI